MERRQAGCHGQRELYNREMSAQLSTVLHSPCKWRPVSLHGAAQHVSMAATEEEQKGDDEDEGPPPPGSHGRRARSRSRTRRE